MVAEAADTHAAVMLYLLEQNSALTRLPASLTVSEVDGRYALQEV